MGLHSIILLRIRQIHHRSTFPLVETALPRLAVRRRIRLRALRYLVTFLAPAWGVVSLTAHGAAGLALAALTGAPRAVTAKK